MVHRDSSGAVATIEPGAVNWMTAGGAVTHTERSHPDDRSASSDLHGLQTWVALPDDVADGPARFEQTAAAHVPIASYRDSTVRVVAGRGFGHVSPVTASSPLVLAEINLSDGSPVVVDSTISERGVIALGAAITLNNTPVPRHTLLVLEPQARVVLGGQGRAMLLGGEPVGRRHIWWNFVHSDPERIEAAKHDWTHQRFPTVPGDHDDWVPLPS